MTREEIISGLKFTVEMFLLDPSTGETITEPRNDMDKTTIDACRGAIELLEQEPCEDAISRQAVFDLCGTHRYDLPYNTGDRQGYDEGRIINMTKLKLLPSVTTIPPTEPKDSEDKTVRRTLENFMRGLWEEIQVGELEYTTSEVYEMLEREIFTKVIKGEGVNEYE